MKLFDWFGVGSLLACGMATVGHRFGFLNFRIAFLLFVLAMLVCSLVFIVGVFKLVFAIARKQSLFSGQLPLTLACGLIPALAFSGVGAGALKAPMIHDITTDMVTPPAFVFIQPEDGYRINSLVYPGEEVSAVQREAYPDITTFFTSKTPRKVFQASLFSASLMGWEIIAQDLASFRFEAVAKTPLFGFTDDIAVRITASADGATAVDVRSMSRVGISDLGTNARRIREFFSQLQVALEEN